MSSPFGLELETAPIRRKAKEQCGKTKRAGKAFMEWFDFLVGVVTDKGKSVRQASILQGESPKNASNSIVGLGRKVF